MALLNRSDVVMLDPVQAQLAASSVTTGQYFQVAATTVLIYHTITTLEEEVKYYWGARLNAGTIVYFMNRYVGILGAVTSLVGSTYGVNLPLCNFTLWTPNVAIINNPDLVTICATDYILMIRVLALHSQAKRLACVLKIILGLEVIVDLGVLIYGTVSEKAIVFGLGGPTVCGIKNSSPLFISLGIFAWATPMVFEVILMVLALYKAAEFWRLSGGFKGLSLVKVLILDQAIYFAMAVACCILEITDFKTRPSSNFLSNFLSSLGSPSFLCVMGSILFFNLKKAGEQGFNVGTSYRSRTYSSLEFA